MFNLKGPQGQNPRTTCGPRTTVWETLLWRIQLRICVEYCSKLTSDLVIVFLSNSDLVFFYFKLWVQRSNKGLSSE